MSAPNPTVPAAARRLVRANVAALDGYVPGEQPTDPRVVKLNTNENPYPPSPGVGEAIASAAGSLHLYPDPDASELRAAAGRLYGVDPQGVVVGNGSDELLAMLLRAVVSPGETVAYPVPTYSLYDTQVALQDGRVLHVPFPADWSLPEALFRCGARMFFVCNPNAPSGTLAPREAIERLARENPDAVVVADEAYVDFCDGTVVGLVGRVPNLVVLRSFSKSYSLAGLRVGLAMTTPELASELRKVKDSYNLDRLAQAGALAALLDQETMLSNVARVCATRARLSIELAAMGFRVVPSQTNFVLAHGKGGSLEGLVRTLKDRGVLVRWFAALPDAMRVSVGTDAQVDRLLEELRALAPG
jgi:histidinol-phosphate aminotransferase